MSRFVSTICRFVSTICHFVSTRQSVSSFRQSVVSFRQSVASFRQSVASFRLDDLSLRFVIKMSHQQVLRSDAEFHPNKIIKQPIRYAALFVNGLFIIEHQSFMYVLSVCLIKASQGEDSLFSTTRFFLIRNFFYKKPVLDFQKS